MWEEQDIQANRRKEIYLIKHPETGHGGDKGNQYTGGKKKQSDTMSFSQDTSSKTGKNKRTIERQAKIGKEYRSQKVVTGLLPVQIKKLYYLLIK